MISQTTKLLKKALDKDESTLQTNGSLFQLGVNYRWSSIVVDERKVIEAEREAEEDAYLEHFKFDDEEDEEKLDSYGVGHDARLRAGDRAPDSSGLKVCLPVRLASQACQLFQIFASSHHTILIFDDLVNVRDVLRECSLYPKDAIRTVVITGAKKQPLDAISADFILDDHDGHAHESYCPTGVCGIVVVRPDGVVGAIARGPTWMNRYFRGIFTAKTM